MSKDQSCNQAGLFLSQHLCMLSGAELLRQTGWTSTWFSLSAAVREQFVSAALPCCNKPLKKKKKKDS